MEFITLDMLKNLNLDELYKLYENHYNSSLYKSLKLINIDINFVNAKGTRVFDNNGREYLDFLGRSGALSIGHNHPKIFKAIETFKAYPNLIQQSINTFNGVLSNNINYLTKGIISVGHITNSGAETIEEAIKLSMMLNKDGKIIYFDKAYHGKTLATISCLGNSMKKNYNTLNNIFIEAPFGDIYKLKDLIVQNNISAILIEPIQGEGGINIPSSEFMCNIRKLCTENNILLIFDEIQTGLGRTGTMFCYQYFNVVPDVICLSKSLSGGVFPIGYMGTTKRIWDSSYGKLKNPTLLTTTFGGNTLACICAIETLTIIKEENLIENSRKLGNYALEKLKLLQYKYKFIKDVRGKGLLIGVEFDLSFFKDGIIAEILMSTIIKKMLNDHCIICGFTENNPMVLRVEPPLIVTKKEIDYFVEALDNVLYENHTYLKLVKETFKNIIE